MFGGVASYLLVLLQFQNHENNMVTQGNNTGINPWLDLKLTAENNEN